VDFDGEHFMVALYVVEEYPDYLQRGMVGVVYDKNGRQLARSGYLPGRTIDQNISLVYSGSRHLMLWNEGYSICYALLGPDASILEPGERCIERKNAVERPQVAWSGSSFQLLWSEYRGDLSILDLKGLQLDEDGNPLSDEPTTYASGDADAPLLLLAQPGLVWGGTHFEVLAQTDAQTSGGLLAFRIDEDGNRLDPEGLELPVPDGALIEQAGLVVMGETVYHVYLDEPGRLWSFRTRLDGLVLDETPLQLATDVAEQFSLAAGEGRVLLSWQPTVGYPFVLQAGLLDDGGQLVEAPTTVASSVRLVFNPVAALGNNRIMMVWTDNLWVNLNPYYEMTQVRAALLQP
jgi:hypothetical protein